MDLSALVVPTYVEMLGSLSRWLVKAVAEKPGEAGEALISARLAPDMFPLATQVRFACVQALEGVSRLRGDPPFEEIDALLGELRKPAEMVGSIAEAQRLLAKTVALIEAAASDLRGGDPDRALAHGLPIGIVFDFTAEQYARDWSLPQFYFHVVTAYAILRHQGVSLGKADYVGHLQPFIRPGTMPQA